jgi:hypothetical protein
MRALPHDEAERRVGAGILGLVESLSGAKLGLRDFKAELERQLEQWVHDAEQGTGPQTPEAKFSLAIAYRDLALRKKSRELLVKSRALTEAAAEARLPQALEDLQHWDIYERQFDRQLRED